MIAWIIAVAVAAAPPAVAPATPPAATSKPCEAGSAGAVCRALAASAAGNPAAAALEFEAAAAAQTLAPDRDRALAAAGNMYLVANQPGKAALVLDRALAGSGLRAEQRGEALLDRARAAEEQNDLKTARAKVTEASQSIGEDPFLWYFSTALAIREGDAATATAAANRALALAPNEPLLLFEAGHAAHLAGDDKSARDYWTRTLAKAAAGSAEAKGAREALALLDKPPAPK